MEDENNKGKFKEFVELVEKLKSGKIAVMFGGPVDSLNKWVQVQESKGLEVITPEELHQAWYDGLDNYIGRIEGIGINKIPIPKDKYNYHLSEAEWTNLDGIFQKLYNRGIITDEDIEKDIRLDGAAPPSEYISFINDALDKL